MEKKNTTTLIGDPSQLQGLLGQLNLPEAQLADISYETISNGDLPEQTDLISDIEALKELLGDIGQGEAVVTGLARAADGDAERRQTVDAGLAELAGLELPANVAADEITVATVLAALDGGAPMDAAAEPQFFAAVDPLAGDSSTPAGQANAAPQQAAGLAGDGEGAGDGAAADGGAPAAAMGGGFWARLLTNIERTVDIVDNITDFIDGYLDRPDIPSHHEAFFHSFLEMLDGFLERLDNLMEVVDRFAPPRFDDWIDHIQDRIAEERDDINAILNPPAPVDEVPEETEPPQTEEPANETPADDGEEETWTADDFQGDGKVVVVIDTGWNTEFLGEDERPVAERDFYDTDGGGAGSAQVANSNDHGSWVDQVVRSVADGVETIHLKVFPDAGGGAPMSTIQSALDWVIDQVKADSYDIAAVNLSLGYGNVTSEVATGLSDEFEELDDLGVFSIVAAGNSGQDGVQVLAADENTIAVSASTSSGSIAGFSQHHEILTDVFAFGQSVRIEKENGGVDTVSGTSFSAPYVSGIAARLQEAAGELIDRSLTDDEFVDILQKSGEDLNGYADDDDPAGYHIADADAALEYFIDHYQDYEVVA